MKLGINLRLNRSLNNNETIICDDHIGMVTRMKELAFQSTTQHMEEEDQDEEEIHDRNYIALQMKRLLKYGK